MEDQVVDALETVSVTEDNAAAKVQERTVVGYRRE